MGREFDSEIIFDLGPSGEKSIFRNVHKMVIFSIPCVTKKFPEHFQAPDPEIRDPRPRLPYNGPIIYVLFDKRFSDPFTFAEFLRFFTFLTYFQGVPIPAQMR